MENAKTIEGIHINPYVPLRLETQEDGYWFNRPFIEITTFEDIKAALERHDTLVNNEGLERIEDRDYEAIRGDWHKRHPSGTKYTVRCFDGESELGNVSHWGFFNNIEDALKSAKRKSKYVPVPT